MSSDPRNTRFMHIALSILSRETLFVYLNPLLAPDDVMLPTHLIDQRLVVLQYGFNMPVPIPDLVVTEMGISGTLSFGGKAVECFVPWECVITIVGEQAYQAALKSGGLLKVDPTPPEDGQLATVHSLDEYRQKRGLA